MSLRVDTSSLISGALVCGNRGLGVLGSEVPSAGDNGAGYLYNDLSLPADAGKEVRGLIVTPPSAGTFFAYEDSSFEFTAPDGAYSFEYRLYVDGADLGTATVSLSVGSSPVTITCTLGTATATGYAATVSQALNVACNLGVALAEGYQGEIAESVDVQCNLGTATALGYQSTVAVGDETVIHCALGSAMATGFAAGILSSTEIQCSIGVAAAAGYQATISVAGGTGSVDVDALAQAVYDKLITEGFAESIAAAILAAAQITPIHSDVQRVRSQNLVGSGVESDPWGPA